MPIVGKFRFRALRGGLLLPFLVVQLSYAGSSAGQISSVAISPDGKLIALSFGKESSSFIYEVPVNTCRANRLSSAKTGDESSPAFSPDGRRIAYSYSAGDGAHSSIVIGNVDGSDLHPWPASDSNYFSPVFSPDNKTLVFSRSASYGSYSPIAQPHPHAWSFYA